MEMNLPSRPPLLKLPLIIAPFFLWGTAMVAMKGVMPETEPFFFSHYAAATGRLHGARRRRGDGAQFPD